MAQDSIKIKLLAEDLLPKVIDLIKQDQTVMSVGGLLEIVKGKSPMELQVELDLESQSDQATALLRRLGRELGRRLAPLYPDKTFSCRSVHGSEPTLLVFTK